MTETDIPPGGEGKIEVTFDSGHKTGKQNKTITVTSNDPRKPTTKLKVAVFVEIEFGFSPTSLGFSKVPHGQTTTKTAKILIKNPDRVQVANLRTSSEFIQAKVSDQSPEDAPGIIAIEVTLDAGLPAGRINEFVTAVPTDTSLKESKLRIGGSIVGDIEITPDIISFMIQQGDSGVASPKQRTLTIVNRSADRPLKIIDAVDSQDRLTLELKTLQEGQQFELLVIPKEIKNFTGNLNGTIVISTDNPSQRTMSVRYSLYRKK